MATATAPSDLIARKVLARGFSLKADEEGAFRAVIATFNVVDKDGEVTLPGAFPEGRRVLISAYGHSSWGGFSAAVLPVGSGVIHQDDEKAWVDGRFWLDTELGKQHYLAIKNSLADGADSEWSYGFRVLKSSVDEAQLEKWPGAWRILEQVEVFEASPVLLGAGVDTGTQWVKSPVTLAHRAERFQADTSELLAHARAAVSMRAKEGRELSAANRDLLEGIADSMDAGAQDIRALLERTAPKDDDEDDGKAALQDLIRDTELDIIRAAVTA